jgi:hypothetical protein
LLAQKKRTKEKGSLKSFSKKDLCGIARLSAICVGLSLNKVIWIQLIFRRPQRILGTGAPKLSAALIFLWFLSLHQDKERNIPSPRNLFLQNLINLFRITGI